MAVLLLAAGGAREVKPADGHEFTVQELNNLVGGYIEAYRLADGWIVCNEDGQRLELPPNAAASAIWGLLGRRGPVVGDVLICAPDEVS